MCKLDVLETSADFVESLCRDKDKLSVLYKESSKENDRLKNEIQIMDVNLLEWISTVRSNSDRF